MTTQEKARKSFEYAVKQASKCRHDLYQISCFSCSLREDCDIQLRIKQALKKLYNGSN